MSKPVMTETGCKCTCHKSQAFGACINCEDRHRDARQEIRMRDVMTETGSKAAEIAHATAGCCLIIDGQREPRLLNVHAAIDAIERENAILRKALQAGLDLWPVLPGRDEPKGTPDVIHFWRQARAILTALHAGHDVREVTTHA